MGVTRERKTKDVDCDARRLARRTRPSTGQVSSLKQGLARTPGARRNSATCHSRASAKTVEDDVEKLEVKTTNVAILK